MKRVYIYAASLVMTLTAAQLHAQDRKQPVSGPVPTVQIGKPTSFVLKNGLKVLVVPSHKLPQVSYTLTIDNAPIYEGNKAGVSSILSGMLGNGTTKMSKEKYNEEIDFLGASISFSPGGASANGLSKYNETILNLMADGAMNAKLTEEEFTNVKMKVIESLRSTEKSISTIASRVENALLYGKNTAAGEFETSETVGNVTLKDVQEYYAKYFNPQNAYLVIVGDVDYKKTEKLVKSLFANWKQTKIIPSNQEVKGNVAKTQIDFVDMPNAVQSEIALVNEVELKMADPDYFAALLANQILGGGGEGRLFLNLREAHGWTYGAYSSISTARKYPGKFKASSSVRNMVTDSAVTEFIKEIDLMRNTLVKDEELKMAKAKFIGNFVMQIQKPETVARYALNKELFKLSPDFYKDYIKNISAVTAQDIQKAAQKYFLSNNMRIVIAGKGSDVVEGLERLNMPMYFYDKDANQIEKPVFKKEIPAGVTVQSVLANYLTAIGGVDKLKAVKTVETKSIAEVQGMVLEITSKTKEGYLYSEQKMMGMVISKQVVTPKAAYMTQQGQTMDIIGEELIELQASAYPFPELQSLKNSTVKLTGIESIDGVDAYAVKMGKTTDYYDVNTGLKLASVQEIEQEGQVYQQEVKYFDYKEVKGIKFPFVQILNAGMQIEIKTKEVKINEGVSDADFK